MSLKSLIPPSDYHHNKQEWDSKLKSAKPLIKLLIADINKQLDKLDAEFSADEYSNKASFPFNIASYQGKRSTLLKLKRKLEED